MVSQESHATASFQTVHPPALAFIKTFTSSVVLDMFYSDKKISKKLSEDTIHTCLLKKFILTTHAEQFIVLWCCNVNVFV